MTTFAANAGNILQHAPLCAIVAAVTGGDLPRESLLLVDAHAMAPLARAKRAPSPEFEAFQKALPSSSSAYARAWRALSQDPKSYPSTANLVAHLWRGSLRMVLCEKDEPTALAIETWRDGLALSLRDQIEVARGDWRTRFAAGLQETGDFTIASFDPYKFSVQSKARDPAHMSPDDIDSIGKTMESFAGGVVVQISTYSINGGDRLPDVSKSWKTGFAKYGFAPMSTLTYRQRHMMTAFFRRGRLPTSSMVDAIKASVREINRGFALERGIEHGDLPMRG